jgi:hypothetical protein
MIFYSLLKLWLRRCGALLSSAHQPDFSFETRFRLASALGLCKLKFEA